MTVRNPRKVGVGEVVSHPNGKWTARVRHRGIRHYLGVFGSEPAAREGIQQELARIADGTSAIVSPTHRHTLASYAERIGVRVGTVKRWATEGMPVLRVVRVVRVDAKEADAWVKAKRGSSVSFERESHVYVAQRKGDGAIKIGFTSDVRRRLDEIGDVVLIACLPGDKRAELSLHARFAEQRIEGEWFAPRGPILDFINSLRVAA